MGSHRLVGRKSLIRHGEIIRPGEEVDPTPEELAAVPHRFEVISASGASSDVSEAEAVTTVRSRSRKKDSE